MSESTNKEKKPSFFKGVKSEFGKITWTAKDALVKESVAVVSVTIIVGLVIAAIDGLLQLGIKLLTSIG